MSRRTRSKQFGHRFAHALFALLATAFSAMAETPVEVVRLTAPNPVMNNSFGLSVAINGGTLVGLRLLPGGPDLGVEALVFERASGAATWQLASQIDIGQLRAWLPAPVAIDGDRMAVGIQVEPTLGVNTGTVTIHERDAGGPDAWSRVARVGTDEVADNFGAAVALDGDRLLVGAPEFTLPRPATAFLYERDPQTGQWVERAVLRPDTLLLGDRFGVRVALSDDTAIVVRAVSGLAQAIIFEPDPLGAWRQTAVLDVSDPLVSFIPCIALEGDRAVIELFEAVAGSGIAVFERNHGGADQWGRVATTFLDAGLSIGSALALSGDGVIAGAAFADTAYRFERRGPGPNDWPLIAPFQPTSALPFDAFGEAVALTGQTVVVGAPNASGGAGAVYVFFQPLFADDLETGDTSRWSVSVP